MKKKNNTRKKLLILSISFSILIIGTIMAIYSYSITKKEEVKVSRISDDYNASLNKSNNIKGADTIFRDSDGNIIEKHEGTYDTTIENKTDTETMNKKADQLFKDFVDKINSGDYDSLYSLFNKEYIDVFQYTKDTFKNKYSFNGKATYGITNIKMNNDKDRIIATVKFTEVSTGYIMLEDFTIYPDGTIADIPIYLDVPLNKDTNIDDVTYKVIKRYETRLGSIFSIEIDNNSNKVVDVRDMLIKNNTEIATYQIISKDKVIKAYPGKPFKYLIKLPNVDGITNLTLQCKELDGTIKDVEIYAHK